MLYLYCMFIVLYYVIVSGQTLSQEDEILGEYYNQTLWDETTATLHFYSQTQCELNCSMSCVLDSRMLLPLESPNNQSSNNDFSVYGSYCSKLQLWMIIALGIFGTLLFAIFCVLAVILPCIKRRKEYEARKLRHNERKMKRKAHLERKAKRNLQKEILAKAQAQEDLMNPQPQTIAVEAIAPVPGIVEPGIVEPQAEATPDSSPSITPKSA